MLFKTADHSNTWQSAISLSLLLVLLLCFGSFPLIAITDSNPIPSPAANEERGIIALEQALVDLGNPFTLMCVAARPGEEDSGALLYYRRKLGARTVVVFATRGEGEENGTIANV